MDSEIEFGQVEQTQPRCQLRPDRNRQLAVFPVFAPDDGDLPIFIDLDVFREIAGHARSDLTVELGGVLLGGQFADDTGQPFVLVTDSLRARHYESTKGSFKFTHDTWEQITRERADFPPDLQMVGWYHTHPDWGVFLSTLDLFICENFFNKPLDVALVVDPCQGDAGFFQWTKESPPRKRRTGGFYLTSSRFRQTELQNFAAYLEDPTSMSYETRTGSPVSSPVVHVVSASPPWQLLAVVGMLSLQFCLLVVIVAKLLLPPGGEALAKQTLASQELASVADRIDRLAAARDREAEVDAKLQVLDLVVRQGSTAPEGVLKSLADKTAQEQELRSSLRAQQVVARELEVQVGELKAALAAARDGEQRSQENIAALEAKVNDLARSLETAQATEHEGAVEERVTAESAGGWWATLHRHSRSIGLTAVVGILAIGAALIVVQHVRQPGEAREESSGTESE